ncbi:hypothetical protein JB92DRAFT_1497717 [Gautieria morchelliformis]|nr:hypothetical protein JB92DRAFT_1497717 [Gautieria morchelliformis]
MSVEASYCVLVSSLLLAVGLPARLNWRRKSPDAFATFARKQVAVFVICLLCSDLIQSISGIIQVKWAAERRLVEGTTCAIQAATLVMGDLGSAVWSCVIAIHTFSALALQRQWSRKVIVSTVVTGWTLVISLTAFGPLVLTNKSNGSFFAIAGTWYVLGTSEKRITTISCACNLAGVSFRPSIVLQDWAYTTYQ